MPFTFTVKGDQCLMRIVRIVIIAVAISLMLAAVSSAHFGMIIPSTDIVGKDDPREISLILQFTHPFEGGPQMDLVKPEKFGVIVEGKVTDLTGTLSEKKVEGASPLGDHVQNHQTRGLYLFHAAQALLGTGRRQVHYPLYQGNRGRFRSANRMG